MLFLELYPMVSRFQHSFYQGGVVSPHHAVSIQPVIRVGGFVLLRHFVVCGHDLLLFPEDLHVLLVELIRDYGVVVITFVLLGLVFLEPGE